MSNAHTDSHTDDRTDTHTDTQVSSGTDFGFSNMTFGSVRRRLKQIFTEAGIETADLDARLLLQYGSGVSHMDLVTRNRETVERAAALRVSDLCHRRLSGEPIDHIIGVKEFYGRDFKVNAEVLTPRPETEGLVDAALTYLKTGMSDLDAPPRKGEASWLLDLGTGSGAILVSLLCEVLTGKGVGIDVSDTALTIARENAARLGVQNRVQFFQGSWFEPLTDRLESAETAALPENLKFDLILSNPPYITEAAMLALSPEVQGYDPKLALSGGIDGLEAYRIITEYAPKYLKPEGLLLLEIGFDQGASVLKLVSNSNYKNARVEKDISGHDRYVFAARI